MVKTLKKRLEQVEPCPALKLLMLGNFPVEALDSQPFSATVLGPISACGTSEGLTQPQFPLRKFHVLEIATQKVAFEKMPLRKYLTLIFLRKTIEHIYVPDIQHSFHIHFGKLPQSDLEFVKMVIKRLVIQPLLESKYVNIKQCILINGVLQ